MGVGDFATRVKEVESEPSPPPPLHAHTCCLQPGVPANPGLPDRVRHCSEAACIPTLSRTHARTHAHTHTCCLYPGVSATGLPESVRHWSAVQRDRSHIMASRSDTQLPSISSTCDHTRECTTSHPCTTSHISLMGAQHGIHMPAMQ